MSGTTDHPPSTTNPTHSPRRVVTTIGAAILGFAVLIGLIAATSGGSGSAAAAEPTTTREDREQIRAFVDGPDALDRLALVAQAVAPPTTAPTTTTTAPPPPPTTTAPPPPPQPAVAPVASGSGYADPSNPAAWDRLAQCEAGGNWAANTGNGYYGGLQFSLGSWQGVGGTGRPDQASRETQIAMGQRLWNQGGWRHWPACTLKLGYR